MRCYADTSWWLWDTCRKDTRREDALSLFNREPDAEVLWSVVRPFSSTRRAF